VVEPEAPPSPGAPPSPSPDDAQGATQNLDIGSAVEANFEGEGRWYAGEVVAAHPDGTFDVRYKDGDSEKAVGPDFIRPKPAAKANKRKSGGAASKSKRGRRSGK
jgi:hypothetical protein